MEYFGKYTCAVLYIDPGNACISRSFNYVSGEKARFQLFGDTMNTAAVSMAETAVSYVMASW